MVPLAERLDPPVIYYDNNVARSSILLINADDKLKLSRDVLKKNIGISFAVSPINLIAFTYILNRFHQ